MTDTKRVLILTADAGFGHRSAANAVKAALEELYGGGCRVEIINPLDDPRTPFFLRDSQADYDTIIKRAPELYHFGYDISDATVTSAIVDGALTVLLYEVMWDVIKKQRPDVILTTYPLYQTPLQAVFTVRGIDIPLLTVITDLATIHRLWFSEYTDACLVPNETVKKLALNYDLKAGKVHITGIPVHPKISQQTFDKSALRARLGWNVNLPTFLAVGSRRVERLMDTLNVVNHFGVPLQLAVVAGKDEKLLKKLHQVEWHIPVHLYEFVENMPELMHAADALISKAGGLTVTEALASGLPLVLIDVIPGQESGNAEFVIQRGAGERINSPVEMLGLLAHWLANDASLLKQRAENARRSGKPEAAYTVARMVWKATEDMPQPPIELRKSRRPKLIELLERNRISWQVRNREQSKPKRRP